MRPRFSRSSSARETPAGCCAVSWASSVCERCPLRMRCSNICQATIVSPEASSFLVACVQVRRRARAINIPSSSLRSCVALGNFVNTWTSDSYHRHFTSANVAFATKWSYPLRDGVETKTRSKVGGLPLRRDASGLVLHQRRRRQGEGAPPSPGHRAKGHRPRRAGRGARPGRSAPARAGRRRLQDARLPRRGAGRSRRSGQARAAASRWCGPAICPTSSPRRAARWPRPKPRRRSRGPTSSGPSSSRPSGS